MLEQNHISSTGKWKEITLKRDRRKVETDKI